jgi:Chaperone of endosialidase
MKKSKFIFCFTSFLILTFPLVAQIRINTIGRAAVGNEMAANAITTYDYENIITMGLFGRGADEYRAGSKLGFGDIGGAANGGINVFIGEYGITDSDKLQLHGKDAIYFTTKGTGSFEAGRFDMSGNLYATLDVFARGVKLTSDGRLKKNVLSLNSATALASILKLRGVFFDWKTDSLDKTLKDLSKITQVAKKDQDYVEKLKKETQKSIAESVNQLGFIAQEIQPVLPSAVSTDEKGGLSVNYIALIPVLVEAIKEQQAQIDLLKKEVETLKKK